MLDLIYVPETPWGSLGAQFEKSLSSSKEICDAAQLNWTVNTSKMYTDLHPEVLGYHAVYREDNNQILGVVNNKFPKLVQNADTFNQVENLIGDSIDLETAGQLSNGVNVFGCFKVKDNCKILDDDIDQYFVVLNEHLKTDGKITVLYTPIRVVCQNTLSAALTNNAYKIRIPVSTDSGINKTLAEKIFEQYKNTTSQLSAKCKKLYDTKLNKDQVNKVLDELFPYVLVSDGQYSKQNENTEIVRNTFVENCLGADNLGNVRGTALQVFNALTDFTQHYFKNVDKAYDLDYRMKMLPGMSSDSETIKVQKFMKMLPKLVA